MKRISGFVVVCVLAAVIGGCSSDEDTPLGSAFVDDGLIGSEPGEVFEDTIVVSAGDTSFVTNALIPRRSFLLFGRQDNYETWIVLKFDFSNVGADTAKTVDSARVRLAITGGDSLPVGARFFELLDNFDESDTLTRLNLAATPIADDNMKVERTMKLEPRFYRIEPGLVQDWIRGNAVHNGIAIVLADTTTTRQSEFESRSGTSSNRPLLDVFFAGDDVADPTKYDVIEDATFVQSLAPPTTNLLLSDGVTRRILLPVDLSSIDEDALLHDAKLRLRLVLGQDLKDKDLNITFYTPNSLDVNDLGVRSGTGVTTFDLNSQLEPEVLEISVRQTIARLIGDPASKKGFVLQFALEGSALREVEFFGSSAADSLKPSLTLTFSNPPRFPRD